MKSLTPVTTLRLELKDLPFFPIEFNHTPTNYTHWTPVVSVHMNTSCLTQILTIYRF